MKRYLESHMNILKVIYYILIFFLFFELIFFSYYKLQNDRTVKYLEGTIPYEGNSSINFDVNEVVVDLREVTPKVKYVEKNSTTGDSGGNKPASKPKTETVTVYRFNYDKDYIKTCKLDESLTCASSKKILGYNGDSLYLSQVFVNSDSGAILGLFEHNIYVYKKTYNIDGECNDKSYGKYEIKKDKIYLYEKANVTCDGCVNTLDLADNTFEIKNNTINYKNSELKLLTKYSNEVINIAYELGYFDGNIQCTRVN